VLDRIVRAMADAARSAGVQLITGDTKVVERGKADGIFINTTGIGKRRAGFAPAPGRARAGDAVIVSGPLGRHGIAIMSAREGLAFESAVTSDSAALGPLVELLRERVGDAVHTLRDPTRGGLASALNEIAAAAHVGIVLDEISLPIPPDVGAACEMLGFDPLYVANEGVLVAFVPEPLADVAVAALREHPLGVAATRIGRAVSDHAGLVVLATAIGGTRVVDMLPGDQLPRIC
jgi:hydrogenase expression/formation protein HypE